MEVSRFEGLFKGGWFFRGERLEGEIRRERRGVLGVFGGLKL